MLDTINNSKNYKRYTIPIFLNLNEFLCNINNYNAFNLPLLKQI